MRRALVLAGLLLGSPAAAQGVDGKRAFTVRCAQCHWDPARQPEQMRIGPSLRGVIGRKAGSHPAFKRYSAAIRQSKVVWNDAAMNSYLENPRKLVPGTTMAFAGLRNPAERAAIIAYLKNPK